MPTQAARSQYRQIRVLLQPRRRPIRAALERQRLLQALPRLLQLHSHQPRMTPTRQARHQRVRILQPARVRPTRTRPALLPRLRVRLIRAPLQTSQLQHRRLLPRRPVLVRRQQLRAQLTRVPQPRNQLRQPVIKMRQVRLPQPRARLIRAPRRASQLLLRQAVIKMLPARVRTRTPPAILRRPAMPRLDRNFHKQHLLCLFSDFWASAHSFPA